MLECRRIVASQIGLIELIFADPDAEFAGKMIQRRSQANIGLLEWEMMRTKVKLWKHLITWKERILTCMKEREKNC